MDQTDSVARPARRIIPAKRDVLPYILLSILLAGVLAVLGGAVFPPYYHAVPALLWSLGFCVSGMLLGFLFGIPRTDMARLEGGQRIKDAGVRTVRDVRQVMPDLPVIVYCSKDTVASYGKEAEAAGARFITASGTSLLAAVNKLIHAS